jgi:hypothetical protein
VRASAWYQTSVASTGPDTDGARHDDRGVQRERPAEAAVDVSQHLTVADEGVRVERRHHAPLPQRVQVHDDRADRHQPALPGALGEALDAADHDAGLQPATVPTERGHRSSTAVRIASSTASSPPPSPAGAVAPT